MTSTCNTICHTLRIEWRETFGYFISIDEFLHKQRLGKNRLGGCRLASSIATCYDI